MRISLIAVLYVCLLMNDDNRMTYRKRNIMQVLIQVKAEPVR